MTIGPGETALSLGRACARKKTPYFMQGIYGLIPYAVPGLGTMGVTKSMVLVYDPEWTAKLPIEECAHVLIHEAIHIYFDHIERIQAGGMDPQLGNIAADLSVNGLMDDMEMKLPHGIYPKDYGLPNGETIEWYYSQLLQPSNKQLQNLVDKNQQADQSGEDKQEGQTGSGSNSQQKKEEEEKSSGGSGSEDSEEEEDKKGQGAASEGGASKQKNKNQPNPQGGVGYGRCGGIGGNPIDAELEDRIDKEMEDQHPGGITAKKRSIQQRMDMEIEQHEAQNGRGSMPSAFTETITKRQGKSPVGWRQQLRKIAMKTTGRMESGGDDFSLAIPSKASYVRGMPLPGMVQLQPEIAFILDTSGSMGTQQIQDAVREVLAVMKSAGIDEAWLLEADADVAAKPKRVRMRNMLKSLVVHGGGGTSYDPALKACMKLRPRPDIIFYLTDGDGYVTYMPPIPVVWVVVHSYYNKSPAKWGHTVFVK